ncbi:MAG TPA: XTP/dITP diphosphatase [Thermodesulfobacteriota bacterium]|nr:XTP/dITP diphosphatase [Thermodesulfobacteriota bacterium]
MTKKLVLGTRNQGKLAEFQLLLAGEDITLFSWNDFDYPFSVVEDGKTFWENAYKKAELTARITNEVSIADDSGLEINYLDQRPGVFSSRYAGYHASDEDNNTKVLQEMRGVPLSERKARFVCAIVICSPDGKWDRVEGACSGVIIESFRGKNGFGYDPIFLVPDLGKTFAELSQEEKNRISHRARAIEKLRPLLKKYFP